LRTLCGHVAATATSRPASKNPPAAAATAEPDPSSRLDWRTQGLIAAGLDLGHMRAQFEEEGYVIVKGVVGEDERMNVAYELEELVEGAAASAGRAGHCPRPPRGGA
jgi:hypothetical protein